jgi:microcompartment protein PduB
MQDDLVNAVMKEVMRRVGPESAPEKNPAESRDNALPTEDLVHLTEYVGISLGDTQGIVIANLDPVIHELMGVDKKFRSIGIIGGRVGAGPQIMAADDAVKATNTEIVSVEMPRDCKGGAGHGNLIVFGAEDVSDARRAVEVSLEVLPKYFGDVYANNQGHLELQYTARASRCLNHVFKTPEGRAFGLILGAPAIIGVLMIDTAVKAADVEVISYASPTKGTSLTNEVMIWVSGDSGAVRQAVISGREVGRKLLGAWGEEPKSVTEPYI